MTPERMRGIAALLGIALATALGVFALFQIPLVYSTEQWAEDYRVAKLSPPQPLHPDIIVVALTEDTRALFPYRVPIDRKFLADLLRELEARKVKGILLDVLFDTPTEPEKDEYLKATLENLKVPIVVSYGREAEYLTEDQVEYIDDFLPLRIRGFANLVKDNFDQTARWIYEGRNLPDGTHLDGVADKLAKAMGYDAPTTRWPLAYRGLTDRGKQPFRTVAAHVIKALPRDWFEGKIAFVGADEALTDRHKTPFLAGYEGNDGIIPGVVIHAHSIAQIIDHTVAPTVGWPMKIAFAFVFALAGVLLARWNINLFLTIGILFVAIIGLWFGGFAIFRYPLGDHSVAYPLVMPSMALLAAVGLTTAYTGRQDRQQKQFISKAFSQYLSPALLEEIVKDPNKLELNAQRRELSFIFTDVASFTTLSEAIEAADLAVLLNDYLGGVCRVVFEHGGTVDKFIGDAVFAIFNAPREQADHAQRAIDCAIDIDKFAQEFRAKENARGVPFGITRIGVHTGIANVGNFGSEARFEYTALGDAVNTAARLEGLNKYFQTRVCASGDAVKAYPDRPYRRLGEIILKGKTQAIPVFQPLTDEEGANPYFARYDQALVALAANDAEAAKNILAELAAQNPEDGVVALHLDRIANGETGTVIEMQDK